MATKPVLVVFLSRETLIFGDETRSRRLFLAGNSLFWRRDPFSSSFLLGKLLFLATRPVLVVFLSRETLIFGDETRSRRHFKPGNAPFWRRDPFSSSFFGRKLIFLATRPVLVVFFTRKTSFFGDETRSHHHYGRELPFLATKIKKTQATKHSSSTCLKIPQYEKPFYKIVTFILIDFLFPSNSLLPHTDFSL
ncbi:hypothetical protein [Caldibacillus thermoamylovorans]|uniref:hypothetical protein n=1 Tax=Caldibacillus thermoamylovorans TaxID=35841 RepID=UPI0020405ADA|nr:hypothetical protein [Caldibacillus thermoamylovorans]